MNWRTIDIFFVAFTSVLLILGLLFEENSQYGTVFFVFIGSVVMTSKYFKDKSIFYRGAYWVTHNIFKPKTNINHLIWGLFLIFSGFAIYLAEPLTQDEQAFSNLLKSSSKFWIGILLVGIFNIAVGLYTAKRK
ncbi:MAG: hypothetical protein CSA21_00305 [Deltaproteobacteria bacterium]|nr:MAG: hypothetical protein CSA21_00305 [Deltaproteobacteria bacterium]